MREPLPPDWKDFLAIVLAVFELVLPAVLALFLAVLVIVLLLKWILH